MSMFKVIGPVGLVLVAIIGVRLALHQFSPAAAPPGTENWQQDLTQARTAAQQTAEGIAYLNGKTHPKDLVKAVALFKAGAAGGNGIAQQFLGIAYLSGQGGVVKDERQAVDWLQKSAEKNIVASQILLAQVYAQTNAVQDVGQALKWGLIAQIRSKKKEDIATIKALMQQIWPQLTPAQKTAGAAEADQWLKLHPVVAPPQ